MDDAAVAPDANAPSPSLPAVVPHRAIDAALVEKARRLRAPGPLRKHAPRLEADWRAYAAWCRKRGLFEPSPDPQLIGLYLAALASERQPGGKGSLNVRSIERRLAGLGWHFRQRGTPIDRQDPHIIEVLAGIRRQHGRPPFQKEPVLSGDVLAMVDTLGLDLRGLRDRPGGRADPEGAQSADHARGRGEPPAQDAGAVGLRPAHPAAVLQHPDGQGHGRGRIQPLHGTAALSERDYVHRAVDRADLIIAIGHDTIEKPPFIMGEGGPQVIHVGYTPANVEEVYFPQAEVVGDVGPSA